MSDFPEALVGRVARRLFRFQFPRRDWIAYPNYTQGQEQVRFEQMARVLMNELADDPDFNIARQP